MKKKLEVKSEFNKKLKIDYGHKFISKVVKETEGNEKIKQLEQVEHQLLEWLKHTHSQQRNQYKNLEKIVHEGYNYYMNSFTEQRDVKYNLHTGGRCKFMSSRNISMQGSHS